MTTPHKLSLRIYALIALFCCSQLTFAEDWIYTVRRGDTLWDLCLKFTNKKNCWQQVGPYNKVDYPPSLLPGTRIHFPVAWLKEQPVSVEVIHVIGDVVVFHANAPTQSSQLPSAAVKESDKLGLGSRIKTGPSSNASLQFADGSVLVLEENSELTLDKLSQHGAAGMVDSRVNLSRGSVKSTVEKRAVKSRFEVSTPSAIAAVRGTDFRVTATESSVMLGEVFEGSVAISTHSQEPALALTQGYGIRVEPNQKVLAPIKLLPQPEFSLPHATPLSTPLTWGTVENAVKYNIQVLGNGENETLLASEFTEKTIAAFPLSAQGCYKIRISAYSTANLRGMPAQQTTCVATAPKPTTVSISWPNKKPLLKWTSQEHTSFYAVEISPTKNFSHIAETITTTDTQIALAQYLNTPVYVRVNSVGEYDIAAQSSNIIYTKPTTNTALQVLSVIAFTLLIAF